ncbi:hypothetical protein FNF27_05434 [Cafeteria roenbergensis]|uniref:SEC7 domain-containing protein n=1 Tax=Cafeteria roenbergensis TaxID=33653 RepID=A0A5A8E5L4_CAFRO|nr:hypothetical protein FNF27_05434 [Cafeteria roenbergensis]
MGSLSARSAALAAVDASLREAAAVARRKSLKKAVASLEKAGALPLADTDARAAFLRQWGRPQAGEVEAGEWLSEEGKGAEVQAAFDALRLVVFRGLDMQGMPFDRAVRRLLTDGGFRLPGEAQRIGRIAHAFSVSFFYDNPQPGLMRDLTVAGRDGLPAPLPAPAPRPPTQASADGRMRLASPDLAEVLAYSVIMLNTDAHNPNIAQERKMSREGFVRNNRGTDADGSDKYGGRPRDLPRAFLEHVYDAVASSEIRNIEQAPSTTAAEAAGATAASGGQAALPLTTCVAGGVPPPDPLFDPCRFAGLDNDRARKALSVDPTLFAAALGREAGAAAAQLAVSQGPARPWCLLPFRSRMTRSVLLHVLRELWPAALRVATFACLPPNHLPPHLMQRHDARTDKEVTIAGLDLLKHALSAALYLRDEALAREAAQTLAAVDAHLGGALDASGLALAANRPDLAPAHGRGHSSRWYEAVQRTAAGPLAEAPARGGWRGGSQHRAGASSRTPSGPAGRSNAHARTVTMPSGASLRLGRAAIQPPPPRASLGPDSDGDDSDDDDGGVTSTVALVHDAVRLLQAGTESHAEAAQVASMAQRFTDEAVRRYLCDSPSRRVLFEGDLVKVARRGAGRPRRYRFVLFSDLLVYAVPQVTAWSMLCCGCCCGEPGLAPRAVLRLGGARLFDAADPVSASVAARLRVPASRVIAITTIDKVVVLVAASDVAAASWRRRLREALIRLARRPATRTKTHALAASAPSGHLQRGSVPPLNSAAKAPPAASQGPGAAADGESKEPARAAAPAKDAPASAPTRDAASRAPTDAAAAAAAAPPAAATSPAAAATEPATEAVDAGPDAKAPRASLPAEAAQQGPSASAGAKASAASTPSTSEGPSSSTRRLVRGGPPAGEPAKLGEPLKGCTPPAGEHAPARHPPRSSSPLSDEAGALRRDRATKAEGVQPPRKATLADRKRAAKSLARLKAEFRAAVDASRSLLVPSEQASRPAIPRAGRLRLWALNKQAHLGDAPLEDGQSDARAILGQPAGHKKLKAWRGCAGMSHRQAMRAFVAELTQRAPSWRVASDKH